MILNTEINTTNYDFLSINLEKVKEEENKIQATFFSILLNIIINTMEKNNYNSILISPKTKKITIKQEENYIYNNREIDLIEDNFQKIMSFTERFFYTLNLFEEKFINLEELINIKKTLQTQQLNINDIIIEKEIKSKNKYFYFLSKSNLDTILLVNKFLMYKKIKMLSFNFISAFHISNILIQQEILTKENATKKEQKILDNINLFLNHKEYNFVKNFILLEKIDFNKKVDQNKLIDFFKTNIISEDSLISEIDNFIIYKQTTEEHKNIKKAIQSINDNQKNIRKRL